MAAPITPPFLPLHGPPSTREHWFFLERSEEEGTHRYLMHLYATGNIYSPSVLHIDRLPGLSGRDFWDTCNKSVPFYILPDPKTALLKMVLHNYVYRRWFRPYRSDIDNLRFICKPIEPRGLPEESVLSRSTINTLISLNQVICDTTERGRDVYSLIPHRARQDGVDYENHILQPLFRALLVIICSKGYNKEDSKHIGPLPVVLVSTGIEDGLSAPVKFDSIKDKIFGYVEGMNGKAVETTLEVAVDLVMGLEAREAEVFGLLPDPVSVWRAHPSTMEMWEKLEGDQPLFGPSSRYMDVKKWTSWQGTGEQYDRWIMDQYEKRAFRNHDRWEAREAARLEESKGL